MTPQEKVIQKAKFVQESIKLGSTLEQVEAAYQLFRAMEISKRILGGK